MELRKDYLLERWVLVGSKRKNRPHQYKQPQDKKSNVDVFAPGNESMTPPEIGRLGEPWRIRWIPNKFPFVEEKTGPSVRKKFFRSQAAYGHHEVIIETASDKQLWDLSVSQINELLHVYAKRIEDISKNRKLRYVQVFKNHGREGGASLAHSHTQIVATDIIPPRLYEEIAASKKQGKYSYKKILAFERKGPRRCFETDSMLAFAPFAPRFNFEVWLFPKRYVRDMNGLNRHELKEMAFVIKKILCRLKALNAPYNMFLHYAPKGEELHMHFEITPRLQKWAGFELSSGILINEITPEEAAEFYRGK